MTLEEMLRNSGTVEFRVRATPGEEGVSCYIHPQGVDGETIDFVVVGNDVVVIRKLKRLPRKGEAA